MNKVEKLQQLIDEIDVLINQRLISNNIVFKNWCDRVEIFLVNNFKKDNVYLDKLRRVHFLSLQEQRIYTCNDALLQIKGILKICMEDLHEEAKNTLPISSTPYSYSKVFIVHGHNGELKQSVARLIEKQGIEAIILDEQANQGRTIIEKFEGNSDVGGAICLFTADDLGRKNGEEKKARARQNVVFEAGYFMGKLGRDHVVIIAEPEIELPSDLLGIVYSNDKDWKFAVLKELKAMGYPIDMNKLFE